MNSLILHLCLLCRDMQIKVIHDFQFDPKALDLEISHHQFNLFQ